MKYKFNPIFLKEMILEARSINIPLLIIIHNLILAVIGLGLFSTAFDAESTGYASGYSDMVQVYSTLLVIEFVVVLFLLPLYSAISFSKEYEKKNMELLLISKVPIYQVIIGKIGAVVCTIMSVVVSSLPVFAIIFSAGGITFFEIMQYVFLIGITAMFLGSMGVFLSILIRKTVIAVLATYLATIFLTIGTFLIVSIIYTSMDHNINADYFSGNVDADYVKPDLKGIPWILLLNPAFSIMKLINNQTASNTQFKNTIAGIGNSEFLVNHWLSISVLLQILVAGVFIYMAILVHNIRYSRGQELISKIQNQGS